LARQGLLARLKLDIDRDPTTGKHRVRYVTVRGTKAAAQAKLARLAFGDIAPHLDLPFVLWAKPRSRPINVGFPLKNIGAVHSSISVDDAACSTSWMS